MARRRTSAQDVSASGCPCTSGTSLRATLRADLERCTVLSERQQGGAGVLALVRALLLYPGFYGVAAYRVSHAALHAPAPVRAVLYAAALLLHRAVITVGKVEISARAHIGPGMLVNHAQGVVVGPVVAGSNLTLSQFASIGMGSNAAQLDEDLLAGPTDWTPEGRCPTLGDRVWIGIGAVVGGVVHLGDDVMVGANSVVGTDLAARAVAVGAPARVSSQRGSFGYVHYRGMLDDHTRAASLAQAQRPVVPAQPVGPRTTTDHR